MYPRLLPVILLLLLSACQSRKSETKATDSTTVAIDTTSIGEPDIPMQKREEEQIISFSEFKNKYIKTNKIGLIQLPLVFGEGD